MHKCILLGRLETLGRYLRLVVACLSANVTFVVVLTHLQRYTTLAAHFREARGGYCPIVQRMNTTIELTLAISESASLELVRDVRLYWVNTVVYLGGYWEVISVYGSLDSRPRLAHVDHIEATLLELHVVCVCELVLC